MIRILPVLLALGAVLASGCAKKPVQLTAEQKQALKEHVGKQKPTPGHPLNIEFGDYVSLVGYDGPEKVRAGETFSVAWYFKVHKPLPEGWQLFTHLADDTNASRINADMDGKLRGFYPPSRWEAGDYVRDPQELSLPEDWRSEKVTLYLGFWKDDQRIEVKGPNDGQRRARVLSLPVVGAKADVPELKATRADEPIALDGKLDEPAWQKAEASAPFVNTMTGARAEPRVVVKSAWDQDHLYVAFEVADPLLKSRFTKDDDHLWEQDCVEIMVDPDGDQKNYVELQVSPANKHFDTRYDSRRVPQPFGHVDYDSGARSGVALDGELNDDEEDKGYTAEIAIPWKAFAKDGEAQATPPSAGDSYRINFYVMDAHKTGMRAVGWSPPRVGDFHVPSRFGKIVFD